MKIYLRIQKKIFKLLNKSKLIYLIIKQEISGKRQIITSSEATFFGDNFATVLNVDFLKNKRFNEAYNDAFLNVDQAVVNQYRGQDIRWRAHIVTWAANKALNLEGDFVECGVYWGILSKMICKYTDFDTKNKKFYLFDSWGDTTSKDENHKDYPKDIYEDVKRNFSAYPNVYLIRGLVPNVLERVEINKIAYLSIDMNGNIAERMTLEKYYDKVVPGGVIYFDDYGWNFPGLRETINDFFSDKPEKLLHFPSGNSIVIKI